MINDSIASDVVQAIKGMGRGFKLVKQSSKNEPSKGGYAYLEFKVDGLGPDTVEKIDKQVKHVISSLGYKWDGYGFFVKRTPNSTISIDIRVQEGRHYTAEGLEIKINEFLKTWKDSKLYKIDNKMIKASSVSDAIKKVKDIRFR